MSKIVLIAAKNPHVRYALSKIVSELDSVAAEAANSSQAFTLLETLSFDLVVLGTLADMSHSSFLAQLSEQGVSTPVVVLTNPDEPQISHPLVHEIIAEPLTV